MELLCCCLPPHALWLSRIPDLVQVLALMVRVPVAVVPTAQVPVGVLPAQLRVVRVRVVQVRVVQVRVVQLVLVRAQVSGRPVAQVPPPAPLQSLCA